MVAVEPILMQLFMVLNGIMNMLVLIQHIIGHTMSQIQFQLLNMFYFLAIGSVTENFVVKQRVQLIG